MIKKIKVLIVDDSALIRQMFESLLSQDPQIEVVGSAVDPFDAREKIKKLNPDVITLDVEMPKMDGLEFLEKIMALRPMPVVMVSSLTQRGAESTIKALELGAIDYVSKPSENQTRENLAALKDEIVEKIKMAAKAKVRSVARAPAGKVEPVSANAFPKGKYVKRRLIAIGASTGGVEALKEVLCHIPENSPPIVVVQHMPPKFTKSFADRLNGICHVSVHEASEGQIILPGNVYIAPGDKHLTVEKHGLHYICRVKNGDLVSGHRPSVDVLFKSVAEFGDTTIGVILTGMGRDGAAGMLKMKQAGAVNIGQDEDTCVVYGMPKEAYTCGAVDIELPLVGIAKEIIKRCLE